MNGEKKKTQFPKTIRPMTDWEEAEKTEQQETCREQKIQEKRSQNERLRSNKIINICLQEKNLKF